VSFSGCKKYEEDDYWFTLRSINKRLVGKKELVECTYNGADSMAFFKRYFGDFYFDFSGDKKDQYGIPFLNVYSKGSNELLNVEGDSKWEFDHGKTSDGISIRLKLNDSVQCNIHGAIKMLTKDELHIFGHNYEFNVIPNVSIPAYPLSLRFKRYED
jgi:hypothetical protein